MENINKKTLHSSQTQNSNAVRNLVLESPFPEEEVTYLSDFKSSRLLDRLSKKDQKHNKSIEKKWMNIISHGDIGKFSQILDKYCHNNVWNANDLEKVALKHTVEKYAPVGIYDEIIARNLLHTVFLLPDPKNSHFIDIMIFLSDRNEVTAAMIKNILNKYITDLSFSIDLGIEEDCVEKIKLFLYIGCDMHATAARSNMFGATSPYKSIENMIACAQAIPDVVNKEKTLGILNEIKNLVDTVYQLEQNGVLRKQMEVFRLAFIKPQVKNATNYYKPIQ